MTEEQAVLASQEALVARLEMLAARVEAQAATIARQQDRIAQLENARPERGGELEEGEARPTASRRAALKRLLGATAALTGLMVARSPGAARADVRATNLAPPGSTNSYGLAGVVDGFDPATQLPSLGSTTHGVIGTSSVTAPSPTQSGAVLGVGNTFVGVQGLSNSNIGIVGKSTSASGIQGSSDTGDGILGFSSGDLKYSLAGSGSGQAHGLVGFSVNQFGVAGINQAGTTFAGFFSGGGATHPGVFIDGTFIATGTKSQAVPTTRHGMRKLYAVEATQPLFEDFGQGRLEGGQARVDLDPVFAATVNTEVEYHVFLTPRSAENRGLAVVEQDARGFVVQELHGGTSSIAFDYRVMAKVRGHERTRLEPFTPPAVPPAPRLAKTAQVVGGEGPEAPRR